MVKANHLIIHRSSTTVSSETSLLWINIFQVYINLFIFNKFTEYLLLLSWPGRRPDDGAELDTSNDTTPVSSLTAVDEGVVAVTWIPWQRKTWWKKASRSVSRVPKKHISDNCCVDCCGKSLSNNGTVKSLKNLVKLSKKQQKGTHITQTYHKRRHYEREIRH